MRKSIITSALAITALLYINSSSYSQIMKTYKWKSYNVKFQIPNTFYITLNDATGFKGGDDDVNLSILPIVGETMTQKKMKESLKDWANSNDVYDYKEITEKENLNGYWAEYIDGRLKSNDLSVTLLMIVYPEDPTTMLKVWISYRDKAFDTALNILLSFTPTY
jgi:hypothetical protein